MQLSIQNSVLNIYTVSRTWWKTPVNTGFCEDPITREVNLIWPHVTNTWQGASSTIGKWQLQNLSLKVFIWQMRILQCCFGVLVAGQLVHFPSETPAITKWEAKVCHRVWRVTSSSPTPFSTFLKLPTTLVLNSIPRLILPAAGPPHDVRTAWYVGSDRGTDSHY
jgi:hypothetical protein